MKREHAQNIIGMLNGLKAYADLIPENEDIDPDFWLQLGKLMGTVMRIAEEK